VKKTGGPVEVIAANQNYSAGLTQDCDTIYWTNQYFYSGHTETGKVAK